MAKYVINEGYDNEQPVENAVDFHLADGYFWFQDSSGATVYAISMSHVRDITKSSDSE
ncbi:hypothetical protein [Microbacterium testaceum]|uniref:hypothetical protein n=1 Tax=Microbacterium testaceum TaxID=2033 RepID=UPI0015E1A2EB|nr:hypothetical protein [Microbacterium testaceum]